MRVLVTGSSGRVGRAIADALVEHGHDVIGLDRIAGPATDLIGSIDDAAFVRGAMVGIEAIVHTAALHAPHVGLLPDSAFRATNVDGTRCLLDAALDVGARHFVMTSSTSIYGHALVPGDRAVWVSEALSPQPRDIYDDTKLAAETLCREAASAGLPCTVLRMSRCFPEPLREMAIFRLHRGVDLRDVAEAHRLALESRPTGFACFNISAASPFVEADCPALLRDAAAVITDRLPAVAQAFALRGWALPQTIDRIYAINHAVDALGYRPRFGIDALLAESAATSLR